MQIGEGCSLPIQCGSALTRIRRRVTRSNSKKVMMDRMRPMIARALREMEERLRAEKTIPGEERIKPKAREKRISGVTLGKTPRLMRRPTIPRMSPAGARRLGRSGLALG